MKLKTIINTKNYLLPYCLIFSMIIHCGAWILAPKYQPGLRLNELFSAKVLIVQNQFVEVVLPSTSTEEPLIEEKAPIVPKVKKRTTKKVRRRHKKRRSLKRRLKTVVKPTVTAVNTSTKVSPAQALVPIVSQELTTKQENQAVASTKIKAKSHTKSQQQVAKRISRRTLRGLYKGYYKSLNSLMSAKRSYPRSARRLGLEGTVLVEMVINGKGEILTVKLIQSSGHELLDQAAIAQVQKIGKVPSAPKEIRRGSMTFHIPFAYSLQS
jgi:TonB family protein